MKRFGTRMIAMTMFGAVAFTGLGAPAVGASAHINEDKFAGVYRVHRSADGQTWYTSSFTLLANDTGSDPQGNRISWSHTGRKVVIYLFDQNETFFVRFDGIRDRTGFSTRRDPGKLHGETLRPGGLGGDQIDGVWYAVKIRSASGA